MGESYFIDSGGSVVPVAPEGVPDAVQLGWVPASAGQARDAQLQAKYGSTGQALLAGVESGASAATLGLSTAAEVALGVDPEGIRGREQANPVASTVGTVAGIAAPLLAGVGLPAALARAGQATARGAAALLPTGATTLGRVASRAAAVGIGSAVEGAAYGAGQVVHEAALGDPHLTAQSALATVGLSAALGGALGGGGGLLAGLAREFTPRDFGARVAHLLEESEAHSNFNATNAMPAKIKATLRGKGSGATALGLEGRDLGIIKNPLVDGPQAIAERAEEVAAAGTRRMDELAKAATRGEAITSWEAIDRDVRGPLVRALRGQGSTIGLADQVETILDRYGQAYVGRALGVEDLWAVRKDIGDFIYRNGKVLDPWVKELNAPIKRVYDHVDNLLQDGIKKASGAKALAAWEEANRSVEVGLTFKALAESGIERSAANNALHASGMLGAVAGLAHAGAPGAALVGTAAEAMRRRGASALGFAARELREALTGKTAEVIAAARQAGVDTVTPAATTAPQAVTALSHLERMRAAVANKVDAGVSTLVRGGVRAAQLGRAEVEAGVPRIFGLSADEAQRAHGQRVTQIGRLAQDPEQLHRALVAMTEGLHDHAPNTAQAAQIAAARAVAFLASKAPANGPQAPLAQAQPVSAAAAAKYARYHDAVEHPLGVLKQAAAGTLTPEAMEAVSVVYPALLGHMRSALLAKAAGHAAIPYGSRLGMSALMGQDMDGSLRTMGRNQSAFAKPSAAAMPGGRGQAGAKLTVAQRALTPGQASAQRR